MRRPAALAMLSSGSSMRASAYRTGCVSGLRKSRYIIPAMLQKARMQVDWDRLDNVFLDMDGTLLDLHFDNYFWQEYLPGHYAERRGVSTAQAQAELRPRFRAVEGTLQWYSADFWSAELGLDVLALTRGLQDSIRVHAGAVELLQRTQI